MINPEETILICIIISCLFAWLFGGIILFHWFLRRSIDRWIRKVYEAFAVDDDAEKRRAFLVEKAEMIKTKLFRGEG